MNAEVDSGNCKAELASNYITRIRGCHTGKQESHQGLISGLIYSAFMPFRFSGHSRK